MVYPNFKSEVADETGKLGSKYPSNLFLTACEFGNLNAVQYSGVALKGRAGNAEWRTW